MTAPPNRLDSVSMQLEPKTARDYENAWDNSPARILIITEPWPDSPDMPLNGGGTANMDPDKFEEDLKAKLKTGTDSRCTTMLVGGDPEVEADYYQLVYWERFNESRHHEAVFVLYYEALHPRQVIERHMPDLLEAYLATHP